MSAWPILDIKVGFEFEYIMYTYLNTVEFQTIENVLEFTLHVCDVELRKWLFETVFALWVQLLNIEHLCRL